MKFVSNPSGEPFPWRDFLHQCFFALFETQRPNATDTEIAEAEKGFQEVIEDLATFWKQNDSMPLQAIDALGSNQYVYWRSLSSEEKALILENDHLDEWLLADTDEMELEEIVKRIVSSSLLCQNVQLMEQAYRAYQRGEYRLSIIGLLAVIDGLLSETSGMSNATGIMQRINALVDRIQLDFLNRKVKEQDAVLVCTIHATLEILCFSTKFEKPEPHNLNRHWLMHGRSQRKVSKLDCIKMLRLIYGILLVYELVEKMGEESGGLVFKPTSEQTGCG